MSPTERAQRERETAPRDTLHPAKPALADAGDARTGAAANKPHISSAMKLAVHIAPSLLDTLSASECRAPPPGAQRRTLPASGGG